jgi:hypothetical protein
MRNLLRIRGAPNSADFISGTHLLPQGRCRTSPATAIISFVRNPKNLRNPLIGR